MSNATPQEALARRVLAKGEELALAEALENDASLESRLTTTMRGVGRRITERPEIVRAMAAVAQLQPGMVIASDTQAAEIADLVAEVISGEKLLTSQVQLALRIPKAMEAAVRGAVVGVREALSKAKETGNGARVAYQTTLRRRAVELEEKARLAAQEAARRAAEVAAETGEDTPPQAEVAPIEVPRTVSGGTGKMGTMVTIQPGEIVDHWKVPQEWLTLVPAVARASFLAACMEKKIQKPEPGESVVWRGVKFTAVESATNRR